MVLTVAEIEAMRIVAWCKDLPVSSNDNLGIEMIRNLYFLGLLRRSKNNICHRPTLLCYRILERNGMEYFADKKARGNNEKLTRRLQMAEIIIFLYSTFGNIFWTDNPSITYTPSFTYRRMAAENILGGTRLAGFLNTSHAMFIPYYLAEINDGIYPHVEERTFRNLAPGKNESVRVIYTGQDSLTKLLTAARGTTEKKQKSTTKSFLDAVNTFTCPVSFVPLGKNGARQLRIMTVPEYAKIILSQMLGGEYLESTKYHAIYKSSGEPFIVGIDWDLKYINDCLDSSKPLHIILLDFQIPEIRAYLAGMNTILHPVSATEIENTLKLPNTLHTPDNSPFITKEGGYVHAPPLKAD